MGVKNIKSELCDGCDICVEDCPMDVLYINSEGKAYVKYPLDCYECSLCEIYCPRKAIEISPVAARRLYFAYDI